MYKYIITASEYTVEEVVKFQIALLAAGLSNIEDRFYDVIETFVEKGGMVKINHVDTESKNVTLADIETQNSVNTVELTFNVYTDIPPMSICYFFPTVGFHHYTLGAVIIIDGKLRFITERTPQNYKLLMDNKKLGFFVAVERGKRLEINPITYDLNPKPVAVFSEKVTGGIVARLIDPVSYMLIHQAPGCIDAIKISLEMEGDIEEKIEN